jgi:hypothetical protein
MEFRERGGVSGKQAVDKTKFISYGEILHLLPDPRRRRQHGTDLHQEDR